MKEALLVVNNLKMSFHTIEGINEVLNDITLRIEEGDVLGLLGESGSGKSITSMSIMNLLPYNAKIEKGDILFKGKSVFSMNPSERRQFRGKQVGMVFQAPGATLNPLIKIGEQIIEVLQLHRGLNKSESRLEAEKTLNRVHLPPRVYNQYPFELSGGMQQRAAIAIAISCHPSLLILDEPTSALDVTVQREILVLLKELRTKGLIKSILFITHDVGVMHEICNHVSIMYAGQIVESGTVEAVLSKPMHPYTKGLLGAVPRMNCREKLQYIEGTVPALINPPKGCRFHTRCPNATDSCKSGTKKVCFNEEHTVWCNLYEEK